MMNRTPPLTPLCLLAALVGCSPHQLAACPEAPSSAAPSSSSSSSPVPSEPSPSEARADLELELTPIVEPRPGVRGRVVVRAGIEMGRLFRVERMRTASLASLSASDGLGKLSFSVSESRDGVDALAEREPRGELRMEYVLDLGEAASSELASRVDPSRAVLMGESAVLLPSWRSSEPARVSLRIGPGPTQAKGAAGTLAAGGSGEIVTPLFELAHAAFVTGELGRARFVADEGGDDVVWSGAGRFDPRRVAAELASARSSLDLLVGARQAAPFTSLIVAERRPESPFFLLPRSRGLLIRVDESTAWDAAFRVRVATALAHRALRSRMQLSFSSLEGLVLPGLPRALGRDALFSLGALSPAELMAEVNSLLAEQALSTYRGKGGAALREAVVGPEPLDAPLFALAEARAALYATRLDWIMRRRTHGARGLRELVRALVTAAGAKNDRLEGEDVVAVVRAEAGDEEVATMRRVFEQGVDVPLSDGVLGGCFRMESVRFAPFELGFVEGGTGESRRVAAVTPGSAAERAGVRAGDSIVALAYTPGLPSTPVRLALSRGGGAVAVRYLPAGPAVAGRGFVRDLRGRDDACSR